MTICMMTTEMTTTTMMIIKPFLLKFFKNTHISVLITSKSKNFPPPLLLRASFQLALFSFDLFCSVAWTFSFLYIPSKSCFRVIVVKNEDFYLLVAKSLFFS